MLIPFLSSSFVLGWLAPSYDFLSISSAPLVVVDNINDNDQTTFNSPKSIRPLVIWHGLGDNYNSSSQNRVISLIQEVHPTIFIHSAYADIDPETDEKLSLFGDANLQIELVCSELQSIPQLQNGFDAIGFSQGGLLLRGLVERCPSLAINNLITFGSPHMGVSDLPLCSNPKDWVCKRRNAILKSQVWLDRIQRSILPALYFRDPVQYDKYIFHSHFLADVNNELVDTFNGSYSENLVKINKLVLIKFNQDTTLVPKDSAWFADVDSVTGDIIPLDETLLYSQDLIGLKELHLQNKIVFQEINEDHMVISNEFLLKTVREFTGGVV